MKKIFQGLGLGLGFVALSLVLSAGVGQALADTTYAVNALSESGALTVTAGGALGFVTGTNAINLGADAAAKTITIGNVSGATAVVVNSGTAGFTVNTTGAGDVTFASADDFAFEAADDVLLSPNSAAGILNLGTGNDGYAINVGTDNTAADTIVIGSALDTVGLTGAVTVTGNLGVTAYTLKSVANTLTAVGTTQADALALTKDYNNVTVGATTTGVKLPVAVAGMDITVRNTVGNTIHIYSAAAETLNGTAGSTGLNLDASTGTRCVAMSTSVWLCNTLGAIEA